MRPTELRITVLRTVEAHGEAINATELGRVVERPNGKSTYVSGVHRCVRGLIKGGALEEDGQGCLKLTDLGRDLLEMSQLNTEEPKPVFFVPVRSNKNTK